jgi:hypothetical protein
MMFPEYYDLRGERLRGKTITLTQAVCNIEEARDDIMGALYDINIRRHRHLANQEARRIAKRHGYKTFLMETAL